MNRKWMVTDYFALQDLQGMLNDITQHGWRIFSILPNPLDGTVAIVACVDQGQEAAAEASGAEIRP